MSTRIAAAVERLGVRPNDHVLEIGCGHGIAVSMICERLVSGKVLAIDRSVRMVEAARRRNAAHLVSGRAEIVVSELEAFDPGRRRFDAVLALRVGLFHRDPEKAHALVRRWLKPGGRLVAEYDEP